VVTTSSTADEDREKTKSSHAAERHKYPPLGMFLSGGFGS
jgi:hypothetical protein